MRGNKPSIPFPGSQSFGIAVKQVLEVITGRTVEKIQPLKEVSTSPTAAEHNLLVNRFNSLLERLQD